MIDFANAAAVELKHEPVPAAQVLAGSPTTGELALGRFGGQEYGVWELTPGAMSDVEANELLIVLSGRAVVELVDDGTAIELAPGVVAQLTAGMNTIWRVSETLRKVYVTGL